MRELKIRNFRDVQGYKNQFGEIMKSHMIFRGAQLNEISLEDAIYMEEELGIRYILDYRDEQEAFSSQDILFPHASYERIGALQVKHKGKGFDFGNMLQGQLSEEKLKFLITYIKEGYRLMPFHNPAYHRLFEILLKGEGHIYFHCSAGKDRTGISAFLIMIALGMSEEDGIKEYMLSNTYLKAYNEQLMKHLHIPQEMEQFAKPLLYVEEENILLTIDAIKEKYDSYDQFLLEEYNLDEKKKERLRSLYCEKR